MPTRVHLAVIMAVLEGSAAAAITYAGLLVFSDAGADRLGAAGFIAIWAGATYGVLSLSPAQRLLATASSSGWLAAGSRVAILCAFAAAFLASSVTASLGWPSPSLDWRHLLLAAGVLIPLRAVLHATVARLMHLGRLQLERVALVGSAENIARMQREAPVWRRGAQPSAVFTTTAGEQYGSDEIAAFVETCVRRNCASVLLVGQPDDLVQAERIVAACEEFALDVVFVPLQEEQAAQLRLLEVLSYGPANSVRVFSKPLSEFDRLIKRALDLVLAVCALILLMPVMLIAALAIKLSSPGPIFYRQDRLGFNGETFSILKFRSMSVMEDGRAMTPAMRKDPRITPVGSVLRRTSIDELPQLINVLKGQMSLVGPRPHALSHDAELARRFAPYARRKRIKPGITGWAQVNGFRGDTSTQMSIESRTLHDLYYVENWSPALDIWILFLTVFSRKVRQNAG
jgi:putative colanic acid biosynthesis UDP-glucose lipid carrier transferase